MRSLLIILATALFLTTQIGFGIPSENNWTIHPVQTRYSQGNENQNGDYQRSSTGIEPQRYRSDGAVFILNVPDDFPTIQVAIESAEDGDLVLVQPGIYEENIDFSGKDITVSSMFSETGDPRFIAETIIDACGQGSVVSFVNGESEDAFLKGFTIRNGTGTNTYHEHYRGGGIYCENSSEPTIEYCLITENHVTFEENRAPGRDEGPTMSGGGIACYRSGPTIRCCMITDNHAGTRGGGVYIALQSYVRIYDCVISHNTASSGGGISGGSEAYLEMNGCIIFDNTAESYYYGEGGGIWIAEGAVTNCRIYDNSAQNFGGGIFTALSQSPRIVKCAIFGNEAALGGGITIFSGAAEIVNSTIYENCGDKAAGGIYYWGNGYEPELPIIVNSILWDNFYEEIYIQSQIDPESIDISYSNIEGGEDGIATSNHCDVDWGVGNISLEPSFVDAGRGDFNLREDSPCIDTGTDIGLPYNENAPDMGALESEFRQMDVSTDGITSSDVTLLANYPNPFNGETTVHFHLSHPASINLSILDVNGRIIEVLADGHYTAGRHSLSWIAEDLPSGIYLANLETERGIWLTKMILVE